MDRGVLVRYRLALHAQQEGAALFLTYPTMGSSERGDALLFVEVGAADVVIKQLLGMVVSQEVYSITMGQLAKYPSGGVSLLKLRQDVVGYKSLKGLMPKFTKAEVTGRLY